MFIAVIQENFDVSEDEKRLQQVKAFLEQKEQTLNSSYGYVLRRGNQLSLTLSVTCLCRLFSNSDMPTVEIHSTTDTLLPRCSSKTLLCVTFWTKGMAQVHTTTSLGLVSVPPKP
jgi:hypothetical protein